MFEKGHTPARSKSMTPPSFSQNPRVSVLMPVYNAMPYLKKAVNSILSQTMEDFEFVIIDDASTDGSVQFLAESAEQDGRIRLTVSDQRAGITTVLNRGVEQACGEYIARMDADDVSLPERFAMQVAFLDKNPDYTAVGGQVLTIDEDGWPIGIAQWAQDPDEIGRRLLMGWDGLCHPAAMIRRRDLIAVGKYDPSMTCAQDKDLWLRLVEHGLLTNLPDVVLKYRVHTGQISQNQLVEQRQHVRRAVTNACKRRGIPMPDLSHLDTPPVPWTRHLKGMIKQAAEEAHYITAGKLLLKWIALRSFGKSS